MEINEIKDIALQLMDALASKKLGEVSIEAEGVKIRVKASAPAPVIAAAPAASPAPAAQSAAPAASAEPETAPADDIPAGTQVKSPLVGTFYSSPSPDEPPFVLAGQEVKEGDTLCIIEAMKVMNEIKAPCSGKVVRIMAQPGDLVEYNQLLCVIE
ncbi:acetyl-CoA carboxylase biotin carboxyl carrier protein [Agathobaculum sp.]|uniref:acetyl-CoA carboxylase biotin carboxyl carrier protein n=1 Tax=Agathobaculum sp. TaxID=2048138 RepID=UPI002673FC62|nr:acetyl-CoA carboxylase biotin carboxyl carrier protein [uncultured Agathobaculum sp.]